MKNLAIWVLMGSLFTAVPALALAESGHDDHGEEQGHEEAGHEEEGEGGHEEEAGVTLTAQQIATAGIKTRVLRLESIVAQIKAPGEIRLNAYATSQVTPRISAQVIERHAQLGDTVIAGQPLLTLSSVEMAQAQGDLLVSAREWKRVRKLGREVVSEQRYTEARVGREQALARTRAYGMSDADIQKFLSKGNAELANGRFQLLALQAGTVIKDQFVLGELVEPGRVLFEVSDESVLWVEAKLTPDQAAEVSVGAHVSVQVKNRSIAGKVIQVHHALDESTRTLGVRIEIPNVDDHLHPGLFVQANIDGSKTENALSVPNEAVLRSPDGDWQVFVEHEPNEFEPKEIEVVRSTRDAMVISGLEAGTKVVVSGAFFLQSELAKSGFEIHNH